MEHLTQEQALSLFDSAQKRKVLSRGEAYYLMKIQSIEALRSLVIGADKELKILTPNIYFGLIGRVYTIGEIIDYMFEIGLTFEALAEGKIKGQYHTHWMGRFLPLLEDFDYSKCDPLMMMLANDQERKETRLGSFHLIDGRHRALAIAYLIKQGKLDFQEIESVLILPVI